MPDQRTTFLALSAGLHGLALVFVVALFIVAPMMAALCVIPAALIACACVPAVPGRPINLYAAFGLLAGFSFWVLLSAVNQVDIVLIVVVLVMMSGAVWLLLAPSVPSVIFTGVTLLACFGLALLMFLGGPDYDDEVPDRGRKSAITTLLVLSLAAAYSGVGYMEFHLRDDLPPRRRKKKRRRAVVEEE